jgi:hypothetical protein
VPAPVAVSDTLPPGQIVALTGVTLTNILLDTITVTVVSAVQVPLVPVTVYVVVVAGFAVTVVPDVALNPVAFAHAYVPAPAPVAVKLAEPPGQITGAVGVTLTVIAGLIVTVIG